MIIRIKVNITATVYNKDWQLALVVGRFEIDRFLYIETSMKNRHELNKKRFECSQFIQKPLIDRNS